MHRLEIQLDFGGVHAARALGTLVADGPRTYFSFDPSFLANPLPISPFAIAPSEQLVEHADRAFDYLPGFVYDAMPDGWGRLMQDRGFARLGVARDRITPLDRLAAVGSSAIGALTFAPAESLESRDDDWTWTSDLAAIADHANRLYHGSAEDVLPQLLAGGGSPGGARPKVLAAVRFGSGGSAEVFAGAAPDLRGAAPKWPDGFDPWIIKFPTDEDGAEAGVVEAVYSTMAKNAGIDVPLTHLFAADNERRYFGIRRFDRHGPGGNERLHMHTFGGVLHADYRVPSCDYRELLRVTMRLTKDMRAVEEAFRRMVFNVLAHNRDDHVRNFAFLMDANGAWRLSPSYDLTYSRGMNGEHTTSIAGEGMSPTLEHFRTIATEASIAWPRAKDVIDQVDAALGQWRRLATETALSAAEVTRLERIFAKQRATARL
ncbi:MAG: type II toxin-antitoxin system HipA family toxin [Gemmatimonadaceae bacterium]